MTFDLSIVIPCYYNELNIPELSKALIKNEEFFDPPINIQYVLVDDGSKDKTFEEITKFQQAYPEKVIGIKLVKNVGSYNAIVAGFSEATGECNVVISADLQDPPSLIPTMYENFKKGYKLVVANREKRNDYSLFADIYHRLTRKFALNNLPKGGFDLALFHKDLKDKLLKISEKNTNCLYLLLWFGYEYVSIPYERVERKKGKSMWTFSKKLKLFIDSFISFSFLPVRFMVYFGTIVAFLGFIYAIIVLILKLTGHINIEGWTAIMLVLIFVSSVQMIFLGVIGEYLWRIFDEVRNRPNYVIEKIIKDASEE